MDQPRLDDAGHHQQQRPQRDENGHQQVQQEVAAEVILEAIEHLRNVHGLAVPALLEQHLGDAVAQRAGEQQAHHSAQQRDLAADQLDQSIDEEDQHGIQPHRPKNTSAQLCLCTLFQIRTIHMIRPPWLFFMIIPYSSAREQLFCEILAPAGKKPFPLQFCATILRRVRL